MQELPDPAIQAITALEKADFKQAVQRFNAALAKDPSILDRMKDWIGGLMGKIEKK
jgi:hypothetical protein